MKIFKLTPIALAFLFIIAPLSGCAERTGDSAIRSESVGASVGKQGKNAVHIVPVDAKELHEPSYGAEYPETATAANGANGFAFRLSAALAEQNAEKNFVCSFV